MEIHQLRYFVAVADEGNFSRAAAKVRVAQPSLSQQIRKLEAEIGQPLFDRLPRSVVLTEAGRCFIDYARQILASIGDARRCVDELKDAVTGKLAVGAIPTIAPYVLPDLVVKFQKDYPEVTLELVEDVTDGITRRIEAGELDVALASTCQPSPTSATRIFRPRTIARAGARDTIRWQSRLSSSWTISNRSDFSCSTRCIACRNKCITCSSHVVFVRRLRWPVASSRTIAHMVAAGIGVSIVPQMMVKHQATPGCVSLPFAPPVPERELNFLHNPLRFQSKAAAAFRREAAAVLSGEDSSISLTT